MIFGVPLTELSNDALIGVCGKLFDKLETARSEEESRDRFFIGEALSEIARKGFGS
jgi:hypothetical protein